MKAAMILNPKAGQIDLHREIASVVAYLGRKGWDTTLWETQGPHQATSYARQAAEQGFEAAVAVGGDGTVSEVANGLVGSQTAMGVIPIGTTNGWALQMGIPAVGPFRPIRGAGKLIDDIRQESGVALGHPLSRVLMTAAAKSMVEGQVRTIDLGQANERYFLMWAGIGFDAEVSGRVLPAEKTRHGTWAYVRTALDTAREYRGTRAELVVDGQDEYRYTSLIILNNIQLYGGLLPMAPKAYLDDGLLDVCMFEGENLRSFLRHFWAVLTKQHARDPRITYFQIKEMTVRTARPLPVHADDEPCGQTPVRLRVVPGALKVIVPRVVPTNLFLEDRGRTPLEQWMEYFIKKHRIQWPPARHRSGLTGDGAVPASIVR